MADRRSIGLRQFAARRCACGVGAIALMMSIIAAPADAREILQHYLPFAALAGSEQMASCPPHAAKSPFAKPTPGVCVLITDWRNTGSIVGATLAQLGRAGWQSGGGGDGMSMGRMHNDCLETLSVALMTEHAPRTHNPPSAQDRYVFGFYPDQLICEGAAKP